MIDESLLKSNFLGRDGFRWWVGQIPSEESHGGQINGAGWGNRVKVRIIGYHPYSYEELPDDELPWAQCLLPTTTGTGAGNNSTSVKVSPSDIVFGFFLDGDNSQIPVIVGCFGRTSQVPSSGKATSPFVPFTGYTSKVKKPNGTLKPDQSGEQNAESQKSPRHVSPEQAEAIDDDEIAYSKSTGDKIQLGNAVGNTTINKISTEVNNLLNKVKSPSIFTNIANEINRVVDKIQAITNGLVGNMMNGLYKAIMPILTKGLGLLYKAISGKILAASGNVAAAHIAGVAAQTALASPMAAVQKALTCVASSVVNSLTGIIEDMLNSVIENVKNFVTCAADQFTGVLVNDIIGKITDGLGPVLGGIKAILDLVSDFSIDKLLRSGGDAIKGLVGMFDCGQNNSKMSGLVEEWHIGCGPANVPAPSFDKILENANLTDVLSIPDAVTDIVGGVNDIVGGVTGAFSAINNLPNKIGNCYTGNPLYVSAPTITIFGGGGSGSTAISLIGAISGGTGSVIGAKVTDGGSGYRFPPFVEIIDNAHQGYGAVARAIIKDGKVDSIYIVSEGENYALGDLSDNANKTTADEVIKSSTDPDLLKSKDYTIDKILILNPGKNYEEDVDDVVKDQFDNEYSVQIDNGSIISVEPINKTVTVNDLPIIQIDSDTGSGAILRPILDIISPDLQGEVKQVIDCVK
jgi:hypothetical protein